MAVLPKIVTIRAYTALGEFKVYPEGETPVHLGPLKDDSIYFVVTVRNDGTVGECFIDLLRGGAQYDLLRVTLSSGQTYTWTTIKLYAGNFFVRWEVRTGNPNTSPWTITDQVSFTSVPFTGFEIHAYYDSAEVAATGKVVETAQTFTTPAYVHVGAAGTYTMQATYLGNTLQQTETVSLRQLLVVEFRFGAPPPEPDIRIEGIILRDSVLGDFNVYPGGETPYITFAGDRRYVVSIKNYGGDAAYVCFCCEGIVTMIKAGLVSGESWTQTSAPIGNTQLESFLAYVRAAYCYAEDPWCRSAVETDRKEFMIGYKPAETFPDPPDRWCETALSLLEGSWYPGLVLDTAVKVVGNASVRYDFAAGSKSFRWDMINGVINCNQYPWLLFYIKCSDPSKIGYIYVVRLVDDAGKQALVDAVLHTADWELKVFPVGEANQMYWGHDSGFNWNKVVRVEFMFKSNGAGSMWIDQKYFRIAPAIARNVFIKVIDKKTGTPIPNITVRLGDYFDNVKFVYGGYMDKTDANGNAKITAIPYEPGGRASYYIFAEDPQQKYVQLPEDDVVVHLENSDQSVTIKMTSGVTPPEIDWLPLLVGAGLMGLAFVLTLQE